MRLISLAIAVLLLGSTGLAQDPSPQLLLDNDFVRVSRVTLPAGGALNLKEATDTVLVRLSDETAKFIPKGSPVQDVNSGSHEVVDLVVGVKKHWAPPVHVCAAPAQCTRETKIGPDPIAWSTTVFTNGFLTAMSHKLVESGTLTSSYYTAKGSDKILVIPFTELLASFGGNEVTLKAGEPYFTDGTQVEVAAAGGESRWLVLRVNVPKP